MLEHLKTVTFSMCMGQKYLIRQQWDFPNVWPPLVEITVRTNLFIFFSKSMSHFQVVSLEKTNSTVGRNMAKTIANNFLNNVLRSIQFSYWWVMELLTCRSEERSGNIYEKYNCTGAGRPGGGGEYDVQVNGGSSLISITKYLQKMINATKNIAGRFWVDKRSGSQSSGKVLLLLGSLYLSLAVQNS